MNLSRRDFLLTSAAVTVSTGLSRYLPSLAPKIEPFAFCFCSDTHVGLKSNLKEDAAMFGEMAAQKPDFIVNGGDVTDYGWRGEYDNYRAIVDPLKIPVHEIAGNHDVRWSPLGPVAFQEGTDSPMHTSFTHKGVHFVLLDSTIPLSHYGHFEAAQLRGLDGDLKSLPKGTPVLVFTHHWIGREGIMVDNEEALLAVLKPHNVLHVFNGHGHSDLLWTWDGIANSMNRGLYQGSWMRVEVDPAKGEVRILRRAGEPTAGAAGPTLLWSQGLSKDTNLVPLKAMIGWPDFRVDGGSWEKDVSGGGILPGARGSAPTSSYPPGRHRVSRKATGYGAYTGFYTTDKPIFIPDDGKTTVIAERALTGGVISHLRLEGDDLYISQMDGALVCLDAMSLKPRWTAKAEGYCHSSPFVTDELVVVGSADKRVHAFDRKTGKPRWTHATGGPVYASATLAKGVVVIGSGDGNVYALDARTGALRWTYALPPSNTSFVQSPAVTDGERVFLGAWDKNLYCLDAATGALLWNRPCTEGKSFAYSPAIGNPVYAAVDGEGKIFVPANANLLWAFDAKSGEPLWKTAAPGDKFGYSSPTYLDGRLYTGTLGPQGAVRCVDAKSGEILWTCETGSDIYDSGPAIGGRAGDRWLAIGRVSGALAIVNLKDGKLRAERQLPTGHFLSTPAARADSVWAATYNDRVMRITVA